MRSPNLRALTLFAIFAARLALSPLPAAAQPVVEDWVDLHPGFLSVGVVTTDDGFIYISGRGPLNADNGFRSDIVTIKYDLDGNRIWVRVFDETDDATNGTDEPEWLTLDPFGNLVVTGVSFINTTGDDILTLKYDPDGNLLWKARSNAGTVAERVATDAAGNVYVAGVTSTSSSLADFLLIKYDPNGVELWTRTDPGGFGDAVTGLAVSAGGEAAISGESSNGESCFDATTLLYEPDGSQRWSRTYTSDIVCGLDEGSDVALGADGEVYLAGHEKTDADTAFLLIRYDAQGNEVWVRTHDEPQSQFSRRLMVDSFGNPVLVGYSAADFAILKYDPNGNLIWRSIVDISGEDSPSNMTLGPDDAVYVTGGATIGSFSVATAKVDIDGNLRWTATWDAPVHSDFGWGVALDSTGNVVVSGSGQSEILTARYVQTEPPGGLQIAMTPLDPPVVIPPEGGSLRFRLVVTNDSAVTRSFDLWLTLSGAIPDRTRGPISRTLSPGESFTRTLRQAIPATLPAGSYTFTGKVGAFPVAEASDGFQFEKTSE